MWQRMALKNYYKPNKLLRNECETKKMNLCKSPMIARKDEMTEFSAPNHDQCTGPLRAQVQVADCDAAAASITVEQVFELHCRIVSTLFNA